MNAVNHHEMRATQAKLREQLMTLERRLEVLLAEYHLAKSKYEPLGQYLVMIDEVISKMELLVGITSAGAGSTLNNSPECAVNGGTMSELSLSADAAPVRKQVPHTEMSLNRPANWNELDAMERMAWFAAGESDPDVETQCDSQSSNVVGFERPVEPILTVKTHVAPITLCNAKIDGF